MKQTLIHGAMCFMALGILLCHRASLHLAVTKKTVDDEEKLLTYLNSALKALLGFDIFPRGTKKVKFCWQVKYVKIHIFFTLHLAVTKKNVGDGEKLLTYLNSALKALLGFDIFPRGTKKK